MSSKLVSKLLTRYKSNIFCALYIKQAQYFTAVKEQSTASKISITNHFYDFKRFKHKKTKYIEEDENDELLDSDEIEFDETESKGTKIIEANVTNLRVDLILKAGLKLSRNKIETAFYQSKIQKNGEKLLKKSVNVSVGDEIDLISSSKVSPNPNFVYVSRIKIIKISVEDELIRIKMAYEKNLLVENEEAQF